MDCRNSPLDLFLAIPSPLHSFFSPPLFQGELFHTEHVIPLLWSWGARSLMPEFISSATLCNPCLQLARPPWPSSTPWVHSKYMGFLCQWCHPTISSSIVPFSSCLQSFPASGSFPMSQFFASGGQSIGVSASASVFPMNIQDWFPLGWTGWISLKSKGLSRVFTNTTVQKYHFFCAQLSL